MRKELIVALIITTFFLSPAQAKCYNYWSGDSLPTFTNGSYCSSSTIKQSQ